MRYNHYDIMVIVTYCCNVKCNMCSFHEQQSEDQKCL